MDYEYPFCFGTTRRMNSDRLDPNAGPKEALDYLYDEGEYYIHQTNNVYQSTVGSNPDSQPAFVRCLSQTKAEIRSMEAIVRWLR